MRDTRFPIQYLSITNYMPLKLSRNAPSDGWFRDSLVRFRDSVFESPLYRSYIFGGRGGQAPED